jgi:hypothetical protein
LGLPRPSVSKITLPCASVICAGAEFFPTFDLGRRENTPGLVKRRRELQTFGLLLASTAVHTRGLAAFACFSHFAWWPRLH